MAKAAALVKSRLAGVSTSMPFIMDNLRKNLLYFLTGKYLPTHNFSLALLKVRKHKTPLAANKRGFYFIHLGFTSFQDFVLSTRVGNVIFRKIFCYLSMSQHASALSWSRRET